MLKYLELTTSEFIIMVLISLGIAAMLVYGLMQL
jgi:hypothetical protein